MGTVGEKHWEAGQVLWHLRICLPLSKPRDMSAELGSWGFTQHKALPLRLPFIYELTLPQPGYARTPPQQRHGFFGSHIIPSPFLCWSFHQLSPCSCGPTHSIQNPVFNYRNSPIFPSQSLCGRPPRAIRQSHSVRRGCHPAILQGT